MKHIHLSTCTSTQLYLKENLSKLLVDFNSILVSTDNQTAGIGRSGNRWDQYPNSLCFSFTLTPNERLSLTALELSLQIVHFFKKYHSITLKVKWPNDIIDKEEKKCGGIICHTHPSGLIIAGIGLNLAPGPGPLSNADSSNVKHYKTPMGYVGLMETKISQKYTMEWSEAIYISILENRFNANQVLSTWTQHCFHMNQNVSIVDGNNKATGLFTGIGNHGEAILQSDKHMQSIYSGSLFIEN